MLATGNGSDIVAYDINNLGQIVGTSGSTSGPRAVRWEPLVNGPNTHRIVDLGNPVIKNVGYAAVAINDGGLIAVQYLSPFGGVGLASPARSFIFTPDIPNGLQGALVPILPRDNFADAVWDINENGLVAGTSTENRGRLVSTVSYGWTARYDSNPIALPTFLGLPDEFWRETFALRINNKGQISGYGYDGFGRQSGFLWTPNEPGGLTGQFRAFPELYSIADVNDHGEIIGIIRSTGNPVLWTETTGMVDLNSLVDSRALGTLRHVIAINNAGQILAAREFPDWQIYLLTPVPEPRGVISALCAVAALRARQRYLIRKC
jgi:hypothetical protein